MIRYNTIRSTEDHSYNDGIGGGSNYSFEGSPNRDSDIYGNIVSHCWDDAIESEGANRNVWIWSNYLHHTFVHVATAATAMGPLYVFRDVFGLSRISHQQAGVGAGEWELASVLLGLVKRFLRDTEVSGARRAG